MIDIKRLKCEGCGGAIEIDKSGYFGTCKHCGSTYLLSKSPEKDKPVKPFHIMKWSREDYDLEANIREWLISEDDIPISERPPDNLSEEAQITEIEFVHLGFYYFTVDTETNWVGEKFHTEYKTVHKEKTVYDSSTKRYKTVHYQESEPYTVTESLSGTHHNISSIAVFNDNIVEIISKKDLDNRFEVISREKLSNLNLTFPEKDYDNLKQVAIDVAEYIETRNCRSFVDDLLDISFKHDVEDENLIFIPIYNIKYTYKGDEYTATYHPYLDKLKGDKPTTTRTLPFYQKPDINSPRVEGKEVLHPKDSILVLRRKTGWVKLKTGDGYKGWVVDDRYFRGIYEGRMPKTGFYKLLTTAIVIGAIILTCVIGGIICDFLPFSDTTETYQTEVVEERKSRGIVLIGWGLPLREEPDTGSPQVSGKETLGVNEEVEIILMDMDDRWAKVRTDDGYTGWCKTELNGETLLLTIPKAIRILGTKDHSLRERPDLSSPLITYIPGGTELEVLDREGGWFRVRTPSGEVGWTSGYGEKTGKVYVEEIY